MINISTGYFVNRMPVVWIVLASCGLTSISPMLMAIINPRWTYWKMAFFAQVSIFLRPSESKHLLTSSTTASPRHQCKRPLHSRPPHHLLHLPPPHTSTRRCRLQHLRSIGDFDRSHHHLRHCGFQNSCFGDCGQDVAGCVDDWLPSGVLGTVCLDGYRVVGGCVWVEEGGEDWCQEGLKKT